MKLKEFLSKWHLTLKLKLPFLDGEFKFENADKEAAWELYIELLTRIATQPLIENTGDEKRALTSVYELFGITREIIKRHGYHCIQFTKIALVVLNQIIRPFTAKWHKLSIQGAFENKGKCKEFRNELIELQKNLRNYTGMLSEMIGVEDLAGVEEE